MRTWVNYNNPSNLNRLQSHVKIILEITLTLNPIEKIDIFFNSSDYCGLYPTTFCHQSDQKHASKHTCLLLIPYNTIL